MGWRRLAGATLAAGVTLLALPAAIAQAAPQEGLGYQHEAQPYKDRPNGPGWSGSYIWNKKQVWCVAYALKAPDSDVEYKEGDELLTKGGKSLAPDIAANISYLLLRYSTTTSADEAAGLSHLLHTWTAAPDAQAGIAIGADVPFQKVAYDEQFNYDRLPASAHEAIARMKADAEANRGPWAAQVIAPTGDQLIGTADTWTVTVSKQSGGGVGGVPVTAELTDAKIEGSDAGTAELVTPADGKPLTLKVVPTGPSPSVAVRLDSPADKPVVHVPADSTMQRIVTTGGEKKLTANASASAKTPPGIVKIGKVDSETKKPLAGAALRVTAADGSTPAVLQDESPLVGPEGTPVVLQTGADGTAVVEDLRTPQEICVVEVAAPKGYEENYDPNAPPKACGKVEPGQTLVLQLSNKPNKPIVPITIPAGSEGGVALATASFTTVTAPGAVAGFAGAVLVGGVALGLVVRRRLAA